MTTTTHAIPEAWPLFLTKEQLCAYLGGMDYRTITNICPVAPLDLGNRVVRYSRPQIDAWASTLAPRTQRVDIKNIDDEVPPAIIELASDADRRMTAVERARSRAQKGKTNWKKTA